MTTTKPGTRPMAVHFSQEITREVRIVFEPPTPTELSPADRERVRHIAHRACCSEEILFSRLSTGKGFTSFPKPEEGFGWDEGALFGTDGQPVDDDDDDDDQGGACPAGPPTMGGSLDANAMTCEGAL